MRKIFIISLLLLLTLAGVSLASQFTYNGERVEINNNIINVSDSPCNNDISKCYDIAVKYNANLFLNAGSFNLNSTLTLKSNSDITGSGIGKTIINFTGTGTAFSTDSGNIIKINLSKFTLNGNSLSDGGIKLGNSGATYSSRFNIDSVIVSGFTNTDAYGILFDNPSHFNVNNSHFLSITKGCGIKILADGVNTGVGNFDDVSSGTSYTNKYGVCIDTVSSSLDTLAFTGSHFSGTSAPIKITSGRGISFRAVHAETNQAAPIVDLDATGLIMASFVDFISVGSGSATSVFSAPSSTQIRLINVQNLEVNNIDSNGNIFTLDNANTNTKIILGLYKTVTTTPSFKTGDDSNQQIRQIAFANNMISYGTAKPTIGTWKAGDLIYNLTSGISASVRGWICKTSGTPGTWIALGPSNGTTANRPTLDGDDAGFTYYDATQGRHAIWNGAAWIEKREGSTGSIGDGGTIAHGLGADPTHVLVTGTVAGEIVTVSGHDATNITVAIKKRADGSAGTSQTIHWQVKK